MPTLGDIIFLIGLLSYIGFWIALTSFITYLIVKI